jgi:hypothetical protein
MIRYSVKHLEFVEEQIGELDLVIARKIVDQRRDACVAVLLSPPVWGFLSPHASRLSQASDVVLRSKKINRHSRPCHQDAY